MSKNDAHTHTDESTITDDVKPIDWHHARPQPRVIPQWDPVKIANEMLDDMEEGGRIVTRKRK